MGQASAWSVEPARRADLDAARALVRATELPVEGMDAHFVPGYVIARAGGSTIGVAGLEVHGHHGLLRSVAVHADWRGRGVGEALVRDRLERARVLALASVHLLTTTAPRWFERFGFREGPRAGAPTEVKASGEFSELCPESAVLMALPMHGRR